MITRHKKTILWIFTVLFLFLFNTQPLYAQSDLPDRPVGRCGTYANLFTDDNPGSIRLSDYIDCIVPTLMIAVKWVFIGVAIILVIIMIYKTVTNWENQDFLKEMPGRWMYIILFSFVAIGAFGTFINIVVLPILGLGKVQDWLTPINILINIIRGWEDAFWS